ncbi:peptidylprolyl isomerase [Prosthecobacter vanneervenii]|uniref:Parvulin-like peptidyl-prolyl isomerase n=1 Tax=Prosthecobacter vanneervenii TaxID=48466 RepID=A0A7W7YDX5_9BACT|nr:peptidylprolyl isomerase [Prosthecobacter vanneervenii]MBB5034396.1 parvulin-like peptidyl-prolyl isomerase [Prosthecobacter vanneervenii]
MTYLRISLIALAAACTSVRAQQPPAARSYTNGIAAVVDGVPIPISEVEETIKTQEQVLQFQLRNDPERFKKEMSELRKGAVETLIDREILLAEFKKIGGVLKAQYVDDDINGIIRESFKGNRDAFVDELNKSGMTLLKFRELRQKMVIMNVMRGRNAGDHPPATPREVQEYYDKNVDKWREGDQIKISTITIPKFTGEAGSSAEKQKKLIQELRTKILQGADFATVAKANSLDSHAENGGAWDWMAKTDLMPAIANAAMELKPGGISQVLDLETNYIIVACDAKKLGTAPPLEQYRPEIEKMINQEKSKANIDKWMDAVRKKHVIKRYISAPPAPSPAPTVP